MVTAAPPKEKSSVKIPQQVKILGFVSLFTDVASEMLYPVTPIFLTAVLGSSMAIVGLMEGLAEITAGFLKGYFGFLSDKIKKRSLFVTAGYSISALSKPLPGILPSVGMVIASRITDRVGKGIRTAPRDALLGSYSKGNSGAVFGFHRGMDTLGAAVGPLISLVLLQVFNNNYQLIFIAAFFPSIIAVGITFFVKEKEIYRPPKEKINIKELWRRAPGEFKLLFVLFTLFASVNSSDVFLILRSVDVAESSTAGVGAYILYNIVYAAVSFPLGKLSDRLGKKRVIIWGFFLFSGVYAGFALTEDIPVIFLLFAIYGIYAAATEGISKAWISDIIPDYFRGSAIGLLTMSISLASLFGSFLTGILWDIAGPAVPFLISAGVSFIIAVIMLKVNVTKHKTLPSM